MKKILLLSFLLSQLAFAEDSKPEDKTSPPSTKLTTKDAKKACKDDGKTGADLIQCMKDKKGEK